jgi:homoserine O-acetyltransferase
MDYFEPFADPVATAAAVGAMTSDVLVVSFDSDWRFDTAHSREIVRTLAGHGAPVTFREVASPHGHDSFLLEVPEYHRTVTAFLDRVARERAPA